MDEADVLIFTTPVYVYHCTGSMKAFLDHYGYRWMVHRPEQKMFTKQAVVISTAAGSGTKSANKDIADSMFFWGVQKLIVTVSMFVQQIIQASPMNSKENRQKDYLNCQ